jgi:3'(2'), 5'-bisphosphate nucleotidase
MTDDPIPILAAELPRVFRWAGAVARELRRHDIAIDGKKSGFANTDALTLADLSLQELLVAALRDMGPTVRGCRVEAEETSGDLGRFATESAWTLAIDPIDGTREYRDRTGDGYAVMLHARTVDTVRYSLVYLPEQDAEGRWLEVRDDRIALGPDDVTRAARNVLDALPRITAERRRQTRRIVVAGFRADDEKRAGVVRSAGFDVVVESALEDSLYPALARGDVAGMLYHTPNVYDFPVCVQLARLLGGDAVWVHDGRSLDFRNIWRDERANMLRLPGIVACAVDREIIRTLVDLARDWSSERYR